jgi:site-specific recombinase XerD
VEDLDEFLKMRQRRGVANTSIERLLWTLRTIYEALRAGKYVESNVAYEVVRPSQCRTPIDFTVDLQTIDKVIQFQAQVCSVGSSSTFDRFIQARRLAILHVNADCGALCAEISCLARADILPNGQIILGKDTIRERALKLPIEANLALQHYLDERSKNAAINCEYVFVSGRRPFQRLAVKNVAKEIAAAIRAAGVPSTCLTPRKSRRAAGVAAAQAGLGWPVVLRALGYRKGPVLKTASVTVSELANLLNRYHPLGRSPR